MDTDKDKNKNDDTFKTDKSTAIFPQTTPNTLKSAKNGVNNDISAPIRTKLNKLSVAAAAVAITTSLAHGDLGPISGISHELGSLSGIHSLADITSLAGLSEFMGISGIPGISGTGVSGFSGISGLSGVSAPIDFLLGECEVWCVVCGVRCAVCGVRCAVCGVRCVVCGVWCVVYGIHDS